MRPAVCISCQRPSQPIRHRLAIDRFPGVEKHPEERPCALSSWSGSSACPWQTARDSRNSLRWDDMLFRLRPHNFNRVLASSGGVCKAELDPTGALAGCPRDSECSTPKNIAIRPLNYLGRQEHGWVHEAWQTPRPSGGEGWAIGSSVTGTMRCWPIRIVFHSISSKL